MAGMKIKYNNTLYSINQFSKMIGKSYEWVKTLVKMGLNGDEIKQYFDWGAFTYMLVSDDELELPYFVGSAEEVSAYLGYSDPNSLYSAIARMDKSERYRVRDKHLYHYKLIKLKTIEIMLA